MGSNSVGIRIETDSLGAIEIPQDALYGSQTQRALNAFPSNSRRTIGSFPNLIRGLMFIKTAAARTNAKISRICSRAGNDMNELRKVLAQLE